MGYKFWAYFGCRALAQQKTCNGRANIFAKKSPSKEEEE